MDNGCESRGVADKGHRHHHHVDPEAGDRRVFVAIAVNVVLTGAQIIGGIVSGSLARIADAIKSRIKSALSDRYDIAHSTLEIECARHSCDAPTLFGGRRHETLGTS